MKKTLVALAAIASVSAFAQSSVSITGLVDIGYGRIDYKGNAVTFSALPNGSATSNFTFLVSDDLGGGLKADARWEIDPDLTQTVGKTGGTSSTGTTSNVTSFLGNGYSFLGLSGGFGAVKFGSINYETLNANGDGNLGIGTAIGSGYRVTSFDAVRAQNSMRYDTPSFNGFSGSYLISEKNDIQGNLNTIGQTGNQVNQTNGRDKVSELGLVYNNGPLVVRYAALTTEQWSDTAYYSVASVNYGAQTWVNGTGAQFKLTTLSVKYDINSAMQVGYFNQQAKSDSLVVINAATTGSSSTVYDRKTNGIAFSYKPNDAIKILVNYQSAANGDSATSAGSAKNGLSTKVLGLGADYSLSKRTVVYARYEKDTDGIGARSITGYTAATNNTTYTATAIGIRTTF